MNPLAKYKNTSMKSLVYLAKYLGKINSNNTLYKKQTYRIINNESVYFLSFLDHFKICKLMNSTIGIIKKSFR